MPRVLAPLPSEEDLLRRLEEAASRLRDLDTKVSPLQHDSDKLFKELPRILDDIKGRLDKLLHVLKLEQILTSEIEILLISTSSECEQLKTQMRSLASFSPLNSKANDRMFASALYKPPLGIEDRESWKQECKPVQTRRHLQSLQKAVDWWEQGATKVAELVESLKSNYKDMKEDEQVLLSVLDTLDPSNQVSLDLFTPIW